MSKKSSQLDYYSLKRILSKGADYNIIFGERSNGKTYSALVYAIEQYWTNGSELAYVRRWKEDVIGKRASAVFDAVIANDEISRITNGEFTTVKYYNGKWYLAYFDADLNKTVQSEKPFAHAFALSDVEHDKSTSYPKINTVIFDEFLTRRMYLPDEFILFMNVLSTIIRERDGVKIFMLGNTVNKYCPYFSEMGLRHVAQMKQGAIDVYHYGNGALTVAVEYAEGTKKKKASNKYFAFDNPNLQMITGGKWELAIYPHLSMKYEPKDIVFIYFIEFEGNTLQCEIIQKGNALFTYVHRKTTPIRKPEKELIYTIEHTEGMNYRHKLLATSTKLQAKIAAFYVMEKVFYQDNEIGEVVREFIRQSEVSQYAR